MAMPARVSNLDTRYSIYPRSGELEPGNGGEELEGGGDEVGDGIRRILDLEGLFSLEFSNRSKNPP